MASIWEGEVKETSTCIEKVTIKSDEALNSYLNTLQEDVSELKIPFDRVRGEIDSNLTKGSARLVATEKLYSAAASMSKTLKEKYTNASNDQKEWKDVKVKLAKTSLEGKVTLNVGGDRYTTSISTLTRERDTFFTELFSEKWESTLDEVDQSIFIDRNGETFAYILEYLRTNVVSDDVLQNEVLQHDVIIEAKFFRLHSLINKLDIFPGGTLLDLKLQYKLSELYGKENQRWELIYKASRDGFDINTFHTRCNNQGPTITIIRSNNNYLFGAYTSIAWTSNEGYKNDTTAFLFTLTNPYSIAPTKYPVKSGSTGNAVYHNSSYGPTFGSGHDLHVANNSNGNNSSYVGLSHAYTDTTGYSNNTFTGGRNFTVADIEVFKQI